MAEMQNNVKLYAFFTTGNLNRWEDGWAYRNGVYNTSLLLLSFADSAKFIQILLHCNHYLDGALN
jgi:hypothetical protein